MQDWAGPVDALLDYILSVSAVDCCTELLTNILQFSDAEIAIGCDEDIAALLIVRVFPYISDPTLTFNIFLSPQTLSTFLKCLSRVKNGLAI